MIQCFDITDMKTLKLKHYAKALVEIAIENNCWDQLLADLKDVSGKLNEELEFKRYLLDKNVGITRKREALEKIFKDFISKRTYNFLLLLIRDEQLLYLDSVLALAEKMNMETGGLREVTVESVVALTPKQEKALEKVVSEKFDRPVVIKNIINPALLGGIKVTVGDTELDSSMQGKIARLRSKIQTL